MFYVCIVNNQEPPKTMYAENYNREEDRDERAKMLEYECYDHDGFSWTLYIGEECFESAYAREKAPFLEGEPDESKQIRLDLLALKASSNTTSVLTKPPINDVVTE